MDHPTDAPQRLVAAMADATVARSDRRVAGIGLTAVLLAAVVAAVGWTLMAGPTSTHHGVHAGMNTAGRGAAAGEGKALTSNARPTLQGGAVRAYTSPPIRRPGTMRRAGAT